MGCQHQPALLKLGRGYIGNEKGPISVTVECSCGMRWSLENPKVIQSRQELEARHGLSR